MHAAKLFSVLALVGASLAAPAPLRHGRKHRSRSGKVVWETVVHTVYVTEIAGAPQPTTKPESSAPQPAPTSSSQDVTEIIVTSSPPPAPSSVVVPEPAPVTSVVQQPPPPPPYTPSPTPEPIPEPTPTPTPTPQPAPPPPAPAAGYMDVVNEWRGKLGLPPFTQSSKREATALKTAEDGKGQMVHQLLPGTFGQVLAPGEKDAPGSTEKFYHVFVGGWLCERPDMPGMNGVCAEASTGWYYTSTGHADILTSTGYKTIGCAWAGGICACDLGQE